MTGVTAAARTDSQLLNHVTWRLIPFLFLLYIVAYIDRVNVGFAQLQMGQALNFSDEIYGLGAGIFFIGYFLFEVPSNLILARIGARRWIARIMVTWGVVAMAMAFVTTKEMFYFLRFVLGLAEAGFFPGIILYLTYWYPASERGRIVGLFMTAVPVSGIIGGPLSGLLLNMNGIGSLQGWQWLLIIEALPAVLLAWVVYRYLPEGPKEASWLSASEKRRIGLLTAGSAEAVKSHQVDLKSVLLHPRVLLLCALYFSMAMGFYGIGMWLPVIIKRLAGWSDMTVGLVSALPYIAAGCAMVLVGTHSDRTGERPWHVAGALTAGVLGLVLTALSPYPVLSIATLALAACLWGSVGPFWALPTSFLRGTGAASGIAFINAVGNLGGFVGPYMVGWIKTHTQNFSLGLLLLASFLAVGVGLAVYIARTQEDDRGTDQSKPVDDVPLAA